MSPRSRRPSRSVRVSGRRRPIWSEFRSNFVVASGAFSNVNLLGDLDIAGQLSTGLTIMQTIWTIRVQNWAAAGDSLNYGLLMGRSDDVGTAAPANALASTDGLTWAWHETLYARADGAAIRVAETYQRHSKAMRRIHNSNDTYLFCVVNPSAASKTFDLFVRTVCALP
jgi:hypothetical protein